MKRILGMILTLSLVLSLAGAPVSAAYTAAEAAEQLHTLGVLKGDAAGGDELDRGVTRREAAAMLVRLLGMEEEALAGSWALPYGDVTGWSAPYVGYACAKGFIDPADEAHFGGGDSITAEEFRGFLLRALGMDTSDKATTENLAARMGLGAAGSGALTRGGAAQMALAAWDDTDLNLWVEGVGKPRRVLEAYMSAITDENSVDYIPVENRIAVFDLDGTLFCETDPIYFDYQLFCHRVFDDPAYKATEEQLRVGGLIRDAMETGVHASGLDVLHAQANAEAFAGMTVADYLAYAKAFMAESAGYTGMTRGQAFYLPMLQLIRFLQSYGFTVYVVSGTNRVEVRALVDGKLGIPAGQVIGTDEYMVAKGQNGADGLNYVYTADDTVVMGGGFLAKNLKMNKVSVIAREIGQQPVLAFGNSSGDGSMANYVIHNNPYRSAAFMLCCDDLERENGNTDKAESMKASCEKNGWVAVSMRDDWSTIYGEGVSRK